MRELKTHFAEDEMTTNVAICLCMGFINVRNMQSVCNGYKIEIQAIQNVLTAFKTLERC